MGCFSPTDLFGLDQILFHFVPFMYEIFHSAQVSQLPSCPIRMSQQVKDNLSREALLKGKAQYG
jgi:hypothetical protein